MNSVSRAVKYLRPYWKWASGAFIGLLIVNGANLVSPQLLKYLIDEGISPLRMNNVWIAVGGIAGAALVRGLFNFLQQYWSEISSQGVAYDLRNLIFKKLQNLSFSYHDQAQTGKLMTRMTSDVELVRMFIGAGVVMLFSAVIMLIGTIVLMLVMNWRLALIVLAFIPVIIVLFLIFVRQITPISKKVQSRLGDLNTVLQENLAGMRVVKAFARESYEKERYAVKNRDLLQANIQLVKLFSSAFPLIFLVANLATVGVVWGGGVMVIGETLTLGELVAFMNYIGYLLMPIFQVGMIASMMSRAEASAERIFEVLDAKSDVTQKPDAVPLPSIQGRVDFEKVTFRYVGTRDPVIQEVTFTANPGEIIAILGETGAGKSTIINLIPRFYDVTGGAVKIDGMDVRDVTLESLRRQIGIVLQETNLFSGTIRDNIVFGRPDAGDDEVVNAARAAQAHEFIMELPDGYRTVVGERGVGLSGGQKQRVAIARALLVDPRILILDDSTSSVDAETEYHIQKALQDLMVGRTSFVIAQRVSTVRNADKILLLKDTRLDQIGTHEELLQTSELYVEILETQFYEEEAVRR